MKKFFLIILSFFVINSNAQTIVSAIGSVNDSIKICAGEKVSLVSKLSKDTLFDFENGLPYGFTKSGGIFTDSICTTNTPSGKVLWFNEPANTRKIKYNGPPNIYKSTWDMKLSSFYDTCTSPFTSNSINQAIRMKIYSTNENTSISDTIVTGNALCAGDQYLWKNYSRTSNVTGNNNIVWVQNPNYAGQAVGSFGLDNIRIWFYIKYDSVIWTCIEYPGFIFKKDTNIVIPGLPGTTSHLIATSYKNGISYPSMDTLKVVIGIQLPVSNGIVGNQTICNNTNETYIVNSQNTSIFEWSIPTNSNTSNNTDSIIHIYYDSLSTGLNFVKVKLSNICGYIEDSILITNRPIENENICYVEYDINTSKNRINWNTIVNLNIDSIYIYREISSYNFIKIGKAKYSDSYYIDNDTIDPQSMAYSYKISATNICGKQGYLSDFHKTISLSVNKGIGNKLNFSWTSYKGIEVYNYELYGIKYGGIVDLIKSVPGTNNTITNITDSSVYLNYYIGFPITSCGTKSNILVKSNFVSPNVGIEYMQGCILKIYPNPVKNLLNIEFSSDDEKKIIIIDEIGKCVFKSVYKLKNIVIDVEYFRPGVYFLRINEKLYKFVKL